MRALFPLSLLLAFAALSPQPSAQALLHELASPNEEPETCWSLCGYFGQAVSRVDDVDGDGVDDLLVGAPYEDPDTSPQDAGRAYVFSGASGTLLHTLASPNEEPTGHFGRSVSGVPDVDGDGRGDLLVGASGELVSAGRAYVFSGATGVLLHELASPDPEPGGDFGGAVSGLPDVDGDGRGDLLVGAYGGGLGGRAYVFSGASGDLLHALVSPNERADGRFGRSVAGFPDADGDGVGDFAVGAEAETARGRVYFYSGATGALGHTFSPPVGDGASLYGSSVSGVPDLDGDGLSDLIVGTRNGWAYVHRGSDGELLHTLVPPDPYGFPMIPSVSGVPDLDGDGRGDLVLGAHGVRVGAVGGAGQTYVFSGATGALLVASHSPHVRLRFGASVTGLGDLDGDGRGDFLIGAPYDTPGPSPPGAGRAYVFSPVWVEPPPLTLSASAHYSSIPPGDSLRFDVAALNPTPEPVTYDLLFSAEEAGWYTLSGTLASGITLEPGASTNATYRFFVPEEAVWGSYVTEVVAVGPDSLVVGVTYFPFDVRDPTAGEPDIEGGDAARALGLAHPNPTRDRATLTLEVGEVQFVTVAVYDALGRRVAVLHEGPLAAGVAYQMVFDGSRLPAGMYVVRAVGETFADTRILTLTR